MPTAHVTVKDFWLPRGKKRWVLKDMNDTLFGVPESMSNKVQKGISYNLTYKEDQWNGRTYLVVENVQPAQEQPIIPAGYQQPISTQRATQPMSDTSKDMHIFTCGAYNSLLRNPSINPLELSTSEKIKFVTEQMEIFRLTLGRKPSDRIETGKPSLREDMDDEIPNFR